MKKMPKNIFTFWDLLLIKYYVIKVNKNKKHAKKITKCRKIFWHPRPSKKRTKI